MGLYTAQCKMPLYCVKTIVRNSHKPVEEENWIWLFGNFVVRYFCYGLLHC